MTKTNSRDRTRYDLDIITNFLLEKIEQSRLYKNYYIADVLLNILYCECENLLFNISIEDQNARNAIWEGSIAKFDLETERLTQFRKVGSA